jgi:hypothetical protein
VWEHLLTLLASYSMFGLLKGSMSFDDSVFWRMVFEIFGHGLLLLYAATVWDPYTKFNINKLGKCQRRAARFVNGDSSRESSVTSMLKELKWPTLQQRRTNTKVVMMYRSSTALAFF